MTTSDRIKKLELALALGTVGEDAKANGEGLIASYCSLRQEEVLRECLRADVSFLERPELTLPSRLLDQAAG